MKVNKLKIKKIIILIGLIIIITTVILLVFNNFDNKVIDDRNNQQFVSTNSLTMLLEIDVDSNDYVVASNNNWPQEGYSFNQELSYCEQGSTLLWNEESKSISLKTSVTDKCYVYFDKEPEIIYLADYIKNTVYTGVDGENGLYYHDGVGSYTNADQEAGDNSYRYSGADPANYVCFGSDAETCPNDNLYRIIGVFEDNVKLIKCISLGYYNWVNGQNIWSQSSLNTETLNGTYLNNFDESWINMIETTNWIVGGMTSANAYGYGTKIAYDYEVGSNSSVITFSSKVGLIYVSDYYYAAVSTYWNYLGYSSDRNDYRVASSNNWLYLGDYEWTISRRSDNTGSTFNIGREGYVNYFFNDGSNSQVRPTFYLKPEVQLIGGNGSKESPFRLAL